MKFIKFANGDLMPQLGLGTWKSAKGEVYQVVRDAIDVGYRHFDCALLYGNEAEIGQAFADAFKAGDVQREHLWVTSKLWNSAHKAENIASNIDKSIADLQLGYLDLYLIHWPVALRAGIGLPAGAEDFVSLHEIPLTETWNGLIDLKKSGKTKHIGVSNFSIKKIQNLIAETGQAPEVNQVEMHPFLQQNALKTFCDQHNIHITAYAPLGSLDRPASRKTDGEPLLFDNPVIQQIAENKGISMGSLLLAWAVNRGVSVIPKTVRKERLVENLAAADISLTTNEMELISKLDLHNRYIKGDFWCLPGNDYTLATLWDE
jgi:alcohol dehydrogenase (NADP+)